MSPRAAAPPRAEQAAGAPAPTVAPSAVDTRRPVWICGVGRSGTSLLHSMLNAHPDVAVPPETHFFRRYVVPGRARRRLARGGVAAFAGTLEADADFARAGIPAGTLLAGAQGGELDPARAFAALLAAYAARRGKTRVGDKDPRNVDHLAALAREFPEGHLLHVVRDPRDVLLSRTRAAWARGRPWWQHALLAQDQLRRGRALGPRLFGARYLEVRYEELVAEPEATLRRVAAHIGVEYAPEMLHFGDSARSLVDERERQWKKETFGPLLAGNVGKWRAELPPRRVAFVEAVSSEAFGALGYERSTSSGALVPVAPLARVAARAALSARRVLEQA